jgi:hypothetical protein
MIRAGLVAVIGIVIAWMIEGTAAAKGGAIALPPLEVNVGSTAVVTGGEAVGPGTDVMVGIHWASLYWRPTSYDIGIGYVGSVRPLRPGYASTVERMTGEGDAHPELAIHGGYLTLGHTLVTQPHLRSWIELRGELLLVDDGNAPPVSALGGAVRLAVELYSSGVGGTGDSSAIAMFAGTVAIGVYLEASHRELALELGPTGITAGVSFRIPFLLVAAS